MPDGGFIGLCPAHDDHSPSLRIWFDDTRARFHCRSGCDTADVLACVGLRWREVFNVTGDIPRVGAEQPKPVGHAERAQLNRYVMQCCDRLPHSEDAMRYMHDRFGMTGAQAAKLRIGFDPGAGFAHTHTAYRSFPRLTVPLLDFSGEPHGLQGRDISGSADGARRWVGLTNPVGARWGLYGWIDGSEDVIVCEGPSDGITAALTGHSVLLIRGAAVARNPELIREIVGPLRGRDVYLAGDNDAAGRRFAASLAQSLGPSSRTYSLKVPSGDLNDWSHSVRCFSQSLSTAKKNAAQISPNGKPVNRAKTRRLAPMLGELA